MARVTFVTGSMGDAGSLQHRGDELNRMVATHSGQHIVDKAATMPSPSNDLYSAYLDELSEPERERVKLFADTFGIEPADAMWALMIVLGRYGDLQFIAQQIPLVSSGSEYRHAGVGQDRAVAHLSEVLGPQHLGVARDGHEDFTLAGGNLHGLDREPVHDRFERA